VEVREQRVHETEGPGLVDEDPRAAGAGAQATTVLSATPLENFARYVDFWNMYPEALTLVEEAGAVRARLQPADDPAALLNRASRARLLALVGRTDEARAQLELLEPQRDAVPAADPRRAALCHQLALGWLVPRELARAEPLLREELDLLAAGGRPEDVQAALSALADLCEADGRPDEAAELRQRLAAPASGEAPR